MIYKDKYYSALNDGHICTDGNWYHESVLKQYFKNGINPKFNEKAARLTHIPLD